MSFRNYWLLKTRLEKEHDKQGETLLKSERQHFYHIFGSLWRHLSRTKFLLVICKVLRLFVNTLTADDKYSLVNRDSLTQPIEILISEKEKNISEFIFCIYEI